MVYNWTSDDIKPFNMKSRHKYSLTLPATFRHFVLNLQAQTLIRFEQIVLLLSTSLFTICKYTWLYVNYTITQSICQGLSVLQDRHCVCLCNFSGVDLSQMCWLVCVFICTVQYIHSKPGVQVGWCINSRVYCKNKFFFPPLFFYFKCLDSSVLVRILLSYRDVSIAFSQ